MKLREGKVVPSDGECRLEGERKGKGVEIEWEIGRKTEREFGQRVVVVVV